jgi:hypothetical protein
LKHPIVERTASMFKQKESEEKKIKNAAVINE